MKTDNLENYLNSFANQVVKESKGILKRDKGSTALAGSIKAQVNIDPQGYSVKFYMADYGTFLDKGVSGNKKKRSFLNYKGKNESSPYSYKKSKGHSQPPSSALDKWIVKKGIAPRDKGGRFISRKSISYLIARSIGKNGIKGLSFFQKPLGLGLKQFGKDLLGNVKQDIIDTLNKTTVN